MSAADERRLERTTRAYLRASRLRRRALRGANAIFDGVWLGLLEREHVDEMDAHYFATQGMYRDDAYNVAGLNDWEATAVRGHFPERGRIVVTAAGSGREVFGLLAMGFDAFGYEPNAELVAYGRELLEREGHDPDRLRLSARDAYPDEEPCDGVIIGWGAYMHVPRREDRITLLRQAGERLPAGGPILLSFFARRAGSRYFSVSARVASAIRRARRRPPIELGAGIQPTYVHYFTRAEIEEELAAAGFEMVQYVRQPYDHAIGRRLGAGQDAPVSSPK
jgi:hypothetical protein